MMKFGKYFEKVVSSKEGHNEQSIMILMITYTFYINPKTFSIF